MIVEERHIGDVWLRDTGCIIVGEGNGRIARDFGFNGWGNRFNFDGDQDIGETLAQAAGLTVTPIATGYLEGGSIDVDGEGRAVTTIDCLLNPNRNADARQGANRSTSAQRSGHHPHCYGSVMASPTITPTGMSIIWHALWGQTIWSFQKRAMPTTRTPLYMPMPRASGRGLWLHQSPPCPRSGGSNKMAKPCPPAI